MSSRYLGALAGAAALMAWSGVIPSDAQQPQIPTLQVCNITKASGSGLVAIPSRADATHSGTFKIRTELGCRPPDYPSGTLELLVDMSDSLVHGTVAAVSFDQVTSTGKHTPTLYINGRCKAAEVEGCRFWLFITDNGTPPRNVDVVGFLVMNGLGKRVAYGTGPLKEGNLVVAPTAN